MRAWDDVDREIVSPVVFDHVRTVPAGGGQDGVAGVLRPLRPGRVRERGLRVERARPRGGERACDVIRIGTVRPDGTGTSATPACSAAMIAPSMSVTR